MFWFIVVEIKGYFLSIFADLFRYLTLGIILYSDIWYLSTKDLNT
jgi:hypothetical protein